MHMLRGGASLQWFKDMDGKLNGNPAKMAQANHSSCGKSSSPMRLAVGTDTHEPDSLKNWNDSKQFGCWQPGYWIIQIGTVKYGFEQLGSD